MSRDAIPPEPTGETHLLRALPRSNRNVAARSSAKTADHIAIARAYGADYFDGDRAYGYGGYRYDGRWVPVARDIVQYFDLKPGDRVLDVGCAKGFLVKDLMTVCPGLSVFGLDISRYALMQAEPETVGRLHLGSADDLPFPDGSFAAVLAINVIHNLPRARCVAAVREIERLAPGRGFIQVDSYHTPAQKAIFESWVLTAEFYDDPDGWRALFAEAGYTGAYDWTIIG